MNAAYGALELRVRCILSEIAYAAKIQQPISTGALERMYGADALAVAKRNKKLFKREYVKVETAQ